MCLKTLLCLGALLGMGAFPLSSAQEKKPEPYLQWHKKSLSEIKKRTQQVTLVQETWYVLETKNYQIETQISPLFTAELSLYMDYLYQHLVKILKFPIKIKAKPKVVIAQDKTTYQRLIGIVNDSRGFFKWSFEDGGKKWPELTLYSFIEFEFERDFQYFYIPILNHEGTHQVIQMQAYTQRIPPFLDEGLATFIQYWRFHEKENSARSQRSEHLPFAKTALAQKKMPPLEELVDIAAPAWVIDDFGPKTKLRYGAAESFVAFLLESDEGRDYLGNIYKAALDGQNVREKIGNKLRLIEKAWLNFLEKM
jgi:hypothetical protein